jgi:FkbM family methyltransferase
MKILGRSTSRIRRHIPRLPKYIWYLFRCLLLFKDPLEFIYAYVTASSPSSGVVELRNGLRIEVSGHPHDAITVFAIFVREDYGRVDPGSTVVDIGANIGVFSLFAIHCQAKKVYAYEPNSKSFQCLVQNIQKNNLKDVVVPHRVAVTSKPGASVKFPIMSSMYNAIITDDSCSEYEIVETTSLKSIIDSARRIDFLKLDCEGGEYDILLNSNQEVFTYIASIRMEYHSGLTDGVKARLQEAGYRQSYLRVDSDTSGNVWYERQ